MRIERNNVLALYDNAKTAAKQDSAASNVAAEGSNKQDRVSFSTRATQNAPIGRMAQSAAAEIETQATMSSRLAQIQSEVSAGSYYVPTDKLVGSIIDVFG